jgi:hypothetical protein
MPEDIKKEDFLEHKFQAGLHGYDIDTLVSVNKKYPFFTYGEDGLDLKDSFKEQDLQDIIRKHGGKLIHVHTETLQTNEEDGIVRFYRFEDSGILRYCVRTVTGYYGDGADYPSYQKAEEARINVAIFTYSEEFFNEFQKYLQPQIKPRRKKAGNNVFALNATPTGMKLTKIGTIKSRFHADNYSDDVVKQHKQFADALNKGDTDKGRLIILDGPPGSGKSYFVKSVISDCYATFVVIPPTILGRVSGPDVLTTLTEQADRRPDKPVVFIVEDSDLALRNRKDGTNLGQLSDLLNFSDGILGELANIWIIATTNADKASLDEAVLRPGRLFSYIQFDKLSLAQAQKVYKRLKGKGEIKEPMTLAELYAKAAEHENSMPVKKEEIRGTYI